MACCCYPYFEKVRDHYYCKNIYCIRVVKLNSLLTIGVIWLSVLYASTDPQFNCTVRFLQTTLSVPENVGIVAVCTTVEGSISGEATAMVTTRNGTATGTCIQCWLWAQFSWRKSVVLVVIHCRTLTVHVPRPCFSFGKIFLYSCETKFKTESLCSRVTFIPIKHANLFLKRFVLSHSALILWTSMTN